LFKGGAHGAMVNNLIFNPGRLAVHYNLWPKEWEGKAWQSGRLSLVGNHLRHGPGTEPGTAFFTQRGAGHLALFLADNHATDRDGRTVAILRDASDGQATRTLLDQADLPAGVRIRPAVGLPDELIGIVGARPWDRDAQDRRVLADMQAGQGRIIDSEPAAAAALLAPAAPVRSAFDAGAWNLDDMSPKAGWPSLFGTHATRQPP
jgi:hypothetical protein